MLMIILPSPLSIVPGRTGRTGSCGHVVHRMEQRFVRRECPGIDSHPDGAIAKPNAHSSQIGPDGNGGGTPPPGGSPLHAVGGGKCLDDPNSSTSEQAGQLCPGRTGNIAGERTVPCRLGIPRRLREDSGEGLGS